MDVAIMISAAGLVLMLQVAVIVQIFRMSERISEMCGKFDMHLKGCDKRFNAIEDRLDKAGL